MNLVFLTFIPIYIVVHWWVCWWVEDGFHPHGSFQGFISVPVQHQDKLKTFNKAWGRFCCHIGNRREMGTLENG